MREVAPNGHAPQAHACKARPLARPYYPGRLGAGRARAEIVVVAVEQLGRELGRR